VKEILNEWKRFVNERTSASTEEKTIKLPRMHISEQWGTPGTEDRAIMEKFLGKIKGNSLGEKIASLESFVKDCNEQCVKSKDVGEILGSLVFLDSLAALMADFNESTGGFLFEALLSVLLGGDSMQVPTKGGKNTPIEDLLDADGQTPLSVKFFFGGKAKAGGSQYIGGSWNNLDSGIERFGQPITYIVVIKGRKSRAGPVLNVSFYSFTVGNDDYPGDFHVDEVGKHEDNPYGLGITEVKQTQFHLGTLDLGSREDVVKIAQKYVERLGVTLTSIYEEIEELSNNVSLYFLDAPEAKSAALKAQKNAQILKVKSDDLV